MTALPGGRAALLVSPYTLADPTQPNNFGAFLFERAPGGGWAARARLVSRQSNGAPSGIKSIAIAGTAAVTGCDYCPRYAPESGEMHAFDLSAHLSVSAEPAPGETADVLTLHAVPNPSRSLSEVWLRVGTPGPTRVAVLDALGRTVALLHRGELAAGEHRFAVPALGPGVYLVRAETTHAQATSRLTRVP